MISGHTHRAYSCMLPNALVLLIHEGGMQSPPPSPQVPSSCAKLHRTIASIVAGASENSAAADQRGSSVVKGRLLAFNDLHGAVDEDMPRA